MAFKMKPKSPLTKKLVGKQHKLPAELKAAIKAAPEKSAMKKTPEERIRRKKRGRIASVTRRLNEGNIKGARLARRASVASSKGRLSKRDRLQRKVDAQDSKFFKDQVERRREK